MMPEREIYRVESRRRVDKRAAIGKQIRSCSRRMIGCLKAPSYSGHVGHWDTTDITRIVEESDGDLIGRRRPYGACHAHENKGIFGGALALVTPPLTILINFRRTSLERAMTDGARA